MRDRCAPIVLGAALLSCGAHAQFTEADARTAIKQAGGPEPFLQEMARQTAKQLPQQINAEMELRSVAALGRRISYTARMLNVEKAQVHDLAALKRANLNFAGCSTPVLGVLIREHGVRVSYLTIAKGTEFLFSYELNAETCKGR